jgi:hypothetical protein
MQLAQAKRAAKNNNLIGGIRDIVAKADREIVHNPNLLSVNSAQSWIQEKNQSALSRGKNAPYEGWQVKLEDFDGDGFNDDVSVYDAHGNLKFINTFGLGRNRRITDKPSMNKGRYMFYQQHPNKQERKTIQGRARSDAIRQLAQVDRTPYQSFVKMCTGLFDRDNRFFKKGKLGNIIRMRMMGQIWNAHILPLVMDKPNYDFKNDPNEVKATKAWKDEVKRRFAQAARIPQAGQAIMNKTQQVWNQVFSEVGGDVLVHQQSPQVYQQNRMANPNVNGNGFRVANYNPNMVPNQELVAPENYGMDQEAA